MMHEGSKHLDVVDSIIATAITCEPDGSEGLSSKDREDLSKLYLKLVDYCGTTHEIRKAWNRHIKYFPHLIRSNSSHKSPSNRISNELKEPRKKIPRLVAKQPSRVRSIKNISQISAKGNKLLTFKSQPIEPHKPTTNQYREKDDNNSVKENTHFQHSENDSAGELEESKHQSENVSPNVSQNHDEIRIETEEEHERELETSLKPVSLEKDPNDLEDTMKPTTANQNPFPATDSSNKQTESDEHETDPQQISSQAMETCKTTHILAASEHGNPESNLQQPQNTSSASHLHLLPQNVQSMVQYPVQSSEQYNQMWQYQNQQQQQQQQNQQQWLQMQQSYQQQQSYIQQQQQLQPQHYQFYQQQQEQYQQYWLQVYQQQQQQLQEYNMQMQQYQQNPQHQIATMSNQMWNGSYDQQGQGMVPQHTTNTQAGFVPHTQKIAANVMAQSMAASALTNIVSPSNQQQSSKSLHSPSLERTLET